jgi:hypothetical protein
MKPETPLCWKEEHWGVRDPQSTALKKNEIECSLSYQATREDHKRDFA